MHWRLLLHPKSRSATQAVALDEVLLGRVEVPTLRLWVNERCLVAGRFDARLPHFQRAQRLFDAQGVPLVQRTSGGTAVWHDRGVFNVSLIVPPSVAPHGVHAAFEQLAQGMLNGLSLLGLKTDFGRVAGTYCDGPHNVVINHKKVAGLAQTRRHTGVLVHASVLVDVDLSSMHEHLELFYDVAGTPKTFFRAGVTTLAENLAFSPTFSDLTDAFVAGYTRQGARFERYTIPGLRG